MKIWTNTKTRLQCVICHMQLPMTLQNVNEVNRECGTKSITVWFVFECNILSFGSVFYGFANNKVGFARACLESQ